MYAHLIIKTRVHLTNVSIKRKRLVRILTTR